MIAEIQRADSGDWKVRLKSEPDENGDRQVLWPLRLRPGQPQWYLAPTPEQVERVLRQEAHRIDAQAQARQQVRVFDPLADDDTGTGDDAS